MQAIKITELDLFLYVNYIEKLTIAKFEYIINNLNFFDKQIEILSKIREAVNSEESIDIKIIQRRSKIKTLLLKQHSYKKVNSLEDENEDGKGTQEIDTFTDKNNGWTAKLFCEDGSSKLYIFNKEGLVENVKIQIIPSGEEFTVKEKLSQPILLHNHSVISCIEIII